MKGYWLICFKFICIVYLPSNFHSKFSIFQHNRDVSLLKFRQLPATYMFLITYRASSVHGQILNI